MTGLSDSFQRPINYLRVSITDRCNLRCIYCMPSSGVQLISHDDILTYEEIYAIVRAAADAGITKVRLTGGEPLARLGLPGLVRMLADIDTIDDIALTTNGVLLAQYAAELKQAGVRRVNVSLDTLKADRFELITRNSKIDVVLDGIETARAVGLNPVKINMVVMAGINDDEIPDFARKTIDEGWHVRFIEYMPVGNVSPAGFQVISASDIRNRLESLGKLEPYLSSIGNGPAKYVRFAGAKGTIGFITPISEHFCFSCNRLRLTADGKLRPCLLSDEEIDLKQPLRDGKSLAEIKKLIEEAVARKPLRHHLAEGRTPKNRPMSQVGG